MANPPKAVSTAEMREIERRASEVFGVTALTLMENAGRGIADLAAEFKTSRIVIVCGKGNNGGDGFAAARYLLSRAFAPVILPATDPSSLKAEAKINFDRALKAGVPVLASNDREAFNAAGLIIDALFGTGLSRNVEEPWLSLIQTINACGRPVLSVDIPSGIQGDTGEILGAAVQASVTAVLGLPKTGLYRGQGPSQSGLIRLVDIGLPEELLY